MMTAGLPWSSVAVKRVFPDNVKRILRPLLCGQELREAFERLGELAEAGNRDAALSLLARACGKFPDDAILHTAYANGLFDKADYQRAAEAYARVLKTVPHDYQIRLLRGAALSRAGRYSQAIEEFTRVVAQHGGGLHVSAYEERAIAHAALGQTDKAEADRKMARQAITSPRRERPPAPKATSAK
ncbi:MAG: tetratricopeptide repeat protein, partial [Planctomycetota bacterium]|jgi:tetratricopeptide (TPR) repeat protein